ncbi:MAG: hypothetical protein SX243_01190 [Acidobacteriota bacterium]|nr:hypothetical protein [Acidobacteriota bacterium]
MMTTDLPDRLIPVYRKGLVAVATFITIFAFYITITTTMFLALVITAISTALLTPLTIAIGPLMFKREEVLQLAAVLLAAALTALVIFIGPLTIANSFISHSRLEGLYEYAKPNTLSHDGIIRDSTDIRDYQARYETYFLVTFRAVRLRFMLHHRTSSLELWGPADWSTNTSTYLLDPETVADLSSQSIAPRDADLLSLTGREYRGSQPFIDALKSAGVNTGDQRAHKLFLKAALRDPLAREIFSFREAWSDFEGEIKDPLRTHRKRALSNAFSRSTSTLFLTSQYLASSLIETRLKDIANLAVTSRIIFMSTLRWTSETLWSIMLVSFLSLSVLGCYYASIILRRYNSRHDPTYNTDHGFVFTVVGFMSLLIAILAW